MSDHGDVTIDFDGDQRNACGMALSMHLWSLTENIKSALSAIAKLSPEEAKSELNDIIEAIAKVSAEQSAELDE